MTNHGLFRRRCEKSRLVARVEWHPSKNRLAVLDETDPTSVALYVVDPDGEVTGHNARFDAALTGISWAPRQ